MKHIKQKIISLAIGGLSYYVTSMSMVMSPGAMWIRIAVFVIVSLIVYFIIKPKES